MGHAYQSDLVDVAVQVHAESDAAIKISDDGEEKNARWVPKSQIEIEKKKNGSVIVTMPEWLAIEKGFS